MRVAALILAAGKGERMGAKKAKLFLLLKDRPVIVHTLFRFEQCPLIDDIFLVLSQGMIKYFDENISRKYGFKKLAKVVAGGRKRQDSAKKGFNAIKAGYDLVMVHDGARPFVSPGILQEAVHKTAKYGATLVAVPVKDTIKMVSSQGEIVQTLNRSRLWAAQTPQTFTHSLLKKAFQKAREDNFCGTDEASLVERIGVGIKIVEGSYDNIKITTPEDLSVGEMILNKEASAK